MPRPHRLIPALLLASCGVPFPSFEPLEGPEVEEFRGRLTCPAPEDGVFDLRAILTHGGADTPLRIRAFRKAPDRIRVNAVAHFGGTAFHAVRVGNETAILRRNEAFPAPIVRSVVADLSAMLLVAPRDGDRVVKVEAELPGLLRERADGRALLICRSGQPPINWICEGSKDLRAKVDLEWGDEGRLKGAWIEDYARDFKVTVRVTDWQAKALDETHFQRPQ